MQYLLFWKTKSYILPVYFVPFSIPLWPIELYMVSDSDYDDKDYLLQFEVAMAISDLIFELNRIMDWHTAAVEDNSTVKESKETESSN